MPTALERAGDFSQTTDNNGNPFNAIYDVSTGLPKTQCVQGGLTAACFQDGGVVGRIPANRLYAVGQNILNLYPLPNITNVPAGQSYNFELTRPDQSITSWQPAVRIDYQPMSTLRGTFKYAAWGQPNTVVLGSLPGFNDTQMNDPVVPLWSASVNYTLTPSTFLEVTVGHASHRSGRLRPQWQRGEFLHRRLPDQPRVEPGHHRPDRSAVPVSRREHHRPELLPVRGAERSVSGKLRRQPGAPAAGLPVGRPGRHATNTPPNNIYPGFADFSAVTDFSGSVTKVMGRHTLKSGYYRQHAAKRQNQGNPFGTLNFGNDTNNPLDAQFGFANALLGVFSSYQQASRFVEGQYVYNNDEAYIQDNWKVTSRLTLDYGMRFVHQQPQYDTSGLASNFLPEKYAIGAAPMLYVAGCTNGVFPCTGTNRQAMNPVTEQFLGPNSTIAIGAIVPNSGNATNGLFLSGQGITKTNFKWPALALAPRFGMAYDLTGQQKMVLRGGAGLFFDRPSGNSIFAQILNPPTLQSVTVRYGQLQTFGSGGLATSTPPALNVNEYDGGLPSSVQWNGGVQMALPWAVALDVSYVGQHQYNVLQQVNLNAVDLGAAFLTQNQDLTLAASATPGATAVASDQMRAIRGYNSITQTTGWLSRTYHSVQLSVQRRFRNGVSFGFNDIIGLYDHQNVTPRLQHAADGSFTARPDQGEADDLLGNNRPQAHIMKANFIWDLPDLKSSGAALRTVGLIVNDWQLAGIWTAATSDAYTVGYSYQNGGGNVNLTGSPDYGGRIRVVGDPGSGCSSDTYRQFSAAAFQGPLVGSVGLDSGTGYVRGCFSSAFDLSIQRTIPLGGGRTIQLRADMFNAFNEARVTGRNTSLTLTSPTDPVTPQNLPFDASGNLIATRSLPKNAGFGVANNYQSPRSVQGQIRFRF